MNLKKLSLLNKIIYFTNLIFLLLWLGAFISPYLNPQFISYPSFLALCYPFLLLVHFLFIIYWMMRLKKVIYLSSIALIMSYFFSTPIFKTKSKFKALAKDNSFSIMSFNSQLSYYSGGKKENVKSQQKKIVLKIPLLKTNQHLSSWMQYLLFILLSIYQIQLKYLTLLIALLHLHLLKKQKNLKKKLNMHLTKQKI